MVRYYIGYERGPWFLGDISQNSLGLRLMFLGVVALLTVLGFVVLLFRFVQRVTLRRIFVFIFVISVMLSLIVSNGQLIRWGNVRRANAALPRFVAAASVLVDEWPSSSDGARRVMLPVIGQALVSAEMPNRFWLVDSRGFPFHEDFGGEIERSNGGVIYFGLAGAWDYRIEYHPNGSMPNSYASIIRGDLELREAIPLQEDRWYLVRYRQL